MSESRRSGEKGRGMMQEVFGDMPLPRARKTFDTKYEERSYSVDEPVCFE